MEQLKAFIEKVNTDDGLRSKAESLVNAEKVEALIELAADNGFVFTMEDYERMVNGMRLRGARREDELGPVVGGTPSKNRYDPNRCPHLTRTRAECAGFMIWCDHYRKTVWSVSGNTYKHICAMGCFNYVGDTNGKPTTW